MDLLHTAGLDSLMLNWTNTLGMQIFFPLTIIGLAARERISFRHVQLCTGVFLTFPSLIESSEQHKTR
jgi:hypothetical protein